MRDIFKNSFVAVGIAMLFPTSAIAVKQMSFDNFSTSDGLSSSLVYSLAQDSIGHIWVGTDFGLNCFDGTVFKSFSKTDYPVLYRNDIGHVACMSNGEIVVGGGNGFLVRYDDKTDCFKDVSPENYASTYQKTIASFLAVPKGPKFYATTSNGIYQYDFSSRSFKSDNPLYATTEQVSVEYLEADGFGNLWFFAGKDLRVTNSDGKILFNSSPRVNESSSVTTLIYPISSTQMMVYGIADRLSLYSISANGTVSLDREVILPFRNLRGIARSNNGAFWFISDGDGLWTTASLPDNTADFQKIIPYETTETKFSKLYSIMVDRGGDLWIGSQNSGLWRLRLNNSKGIFTATELGMSNCVATGFADIDGNRHLVASDGIGVFGYSDQNLSTTLYGPSNGLTNKNVTSVLNDGNGKIWVTTWGGGLYSSSTADVHFKNETFHGIASPRSNLFSIIRLKDGDYWVCAGGDGLYVMHNGVWSLKQLKHPKYGPDPDRWPYFVVEAGTDIRWVFTSTTVWIYKLGILSPIQAHYHGDSKDQMVSILDACFVPNYGMIAATNRGLLLFKEDGSSFEKLDYCPNSEYSSVLYASDGEVWTSGMEGILKIDLKNKVCIPYPFDFSSRGQNYFKTRSKIIDSNGRIYFGNRDGFFSFNPKTAVLNSQLGHVGISQFIINGTPVKFAYADSTDVNAGVTMLFNDKNRGDWGVNGNGGSINLKYGETNVDIQLDVIDFNECPIRLFYRLNGLSDKWNPVPSDKSFIFSYIPSGSYTLQIASLDSKLDEPVIHFSLDLNVSPPWWSTWWFRILLLLLIIGAVYVKYRSIIREKIVLQQKVDERTSELKSKNLLIEKRNAELNRVLSYKDRLIAVVAHDLKNPMFAIVGALEGLLRKNDAMPTADRQKVLGDVLGSARTLQNEMSKLLAWATSSQDDIEYRPSNTDLAKVIDSDLALLQASADGKGVLLHSDVNVKNFCYVDARMISTVIRNVVSNSIKFTPAGKSVSIKAWQEGGVAKIQIADEGVGMSVEKLRELQSEGRHSSTQGTDGEKGTGLGVGIVRDYVLQNNGTYKLQSKLNQGTTTTITLPLADVEVIESQLSAVDKVPDFEVDTELMDGNNILVVDDDPLICQNIKNMLDAYVNVLVANNGRQALDIMAQNAVDIVVSDVEMPVMNGIDMSMELSKNDTYSHIPILFLSAKSTESDRLLGLLTGAIDYIPKPFSQNELLIKLNNILSLRQKQQKRLLAEQIFSAGDSMVTHTEFASDEKLVDDVDEIEENMPNTSEPSTSDSKDAKINPLLQEMLAIVEKNYADSEYSVERLAEDMCMTKITLYRRVKSLSGQTPVELLSDFRLHKALSLLKEGNIQVGDVAFQVGFSDPAYFTRRFRALFGYTPSSVKPSK